MGAWEKEEIVRMEVMYESNCWYRSRAMKEKMGRIRQNIHLICSEQREASSEQRVTVQNYYYVSSILNCVRAGVFLANEISGKIQIIFGIFLITAGCVNQFVTIPKNFPAKIHLHTI